MGNSKRKRKDSGCQGRKPILQVCVEETSATVQEIAKRLPAESGASLNFGADVLAVLMVCFLGGFGVLPQNQILPSLVAVLVFMLICGAGVKLMRSVNKSSPS